MAKKRKWIQRAVKRPGAFTAWCKKHGFSGPTKACIVYAKKVAKKTGNKSLMGQALFAQKAKKGF